MKAIPYQCKVCGKPGTLTVDETYYELGDPHKLIEMATCNGCFDLIQEQRSVADKIGMVLMQWERAVGGGDGPKLESSTRSRLSILCDKYASWARRRYGLSYKWVFEDITNQMMDHPDKWPIVLRVYREQVQKRVEAERTKETQP